MFYKNDAEDLLKRCGGIE